MPSASGRSGSALPMSTSQLGAPSMGKNTLDTNATGNTTAPRIGPPDSAGMTREAPMPSSVKQVTPSSSVTARPGSVAARTGTP